MKMTRYVIRSMSTTDFNWRSKEPVRPYHIYLLPPEKRSRRLTGRTPALR